MWACIRLARRLVRAIGVMMRKFRIVLFFVGAAVVAAGAVAPPTSASAQAPTVLDDARLVTVRGRIANAVQVARAEGLPAEWLLAKAAEGLAKHVPPPRIAAAVEMLLVRIRQGQTVVAELPTHAQPRRTLRAVVEALSVGAPVAELRGLATDVVRADRARAVALLRAGVTTVAELGERGVPGRDAARLTRAALQSGGPAAWRRLIAAASRTEGQSPGRRLGAIRAAAVGAGRGLGASKRPVEVGGRGSAGPPHDDSFSQGQGRALGRGMSMAP